MPYITDEEKKDLDRSIKTLSTLLRKGDFRGRLNYSISSIFNNLIQGNGLSYRLINDFIGVLECVKLESYRRIATPYEDSKIVANGDIYLPAHQIISNCLCCGSQDKVFSKDGYCKSCVLEKAGFDSALRTVTPIDADIEDISQEGTD